MRLPPTITEVSSHATRRGVSLAEVMIVTAVIAIVAGAVAPHLRSSETAARATASTVTADLQFIRVVATEHAATCTVTFDGLAAYTTASSSTVAAQKLSIGVTTGSHAATISKPVGVDSSTVYDAIVFTSTGQLDGITEDVEIDVTVGSSRRTIAVRWRTGAVSAGGAS